MHSSNTLIIIVIEGEEIAFCIIEFLSKIAQTHSFGYNFVTMKKQFIHHLLLIIAIGFFSTEVFSMNYRSPEPEPIPIDKGKPGKRPRAPRQAEVTMSYDGTYLYICFNPSQGDAVVSLATAEMEYEVSVSTDEPISLLVGCVEENSVVTIETEQGNTYIGYF